MHAGISDQEPPECLSFLQEVDKLRMEDVAKKEAATKRAEAAMGEAETIRRKGFATISQYKEKLAKLQIKRKAVSLKSLEEALHQIALRVRIWSVESA